MLDDSETHGLAGLDLESVRTFLNPPTTEPLFLNLREMVSQLQSDKT